MAYILGVVCMDEFIEERAKLVRWLAERADPFTKIRLLSLAERYEDRLGLRPRAVRQRKVPIGLPPVNLGSNER
jgi:hypothetical protein